MSYTPPKVLTFRLQIRGCMLVSTPHSIATVSSQIIFARLDILILLRLSNYDVGEIAFVRALWALPNLIELAWLRCTHVAMRIAWECKARRTVSLFTGRSPRWSFHRVTRLSYGVAVGRIRDR